MATSTVSTQAPPWWQDLAQTAGQRGLGLANAPFTPYGGQMVAGLMPEQEAALQMQATRATQGSPLMAAGQGLLQNTMQGQFLGQGNPYLQGIINDTTRDVTGQVQKSIGMNSFGGSVNQEMLTKNLAQAQNALRYQNYGDERSRQMQALGMAPTYAANDFADAQQLFQAGAVRQGLNQQVADANRGEFMRAQEWPFKGQQALVSSLGLNPGNIATQTSPDPSKAGQILGGGMLGAGIGNMVGGSTDLWGLLPGSVNSTLLGGIGGGLLGLLL